MVNRQRMPGRRARQRGFALVDVIVGTILLGVALAVMIGLSGRAVSSMARGREIATAAMLADEQLSMVLAHGPDDYGRRFPTEGACEEPFQAYSYHLEFAGGSASRPYQVKCTISWSSGVAPQSIAVETLVAARSVAGTEEIDPDRAPTAAVSRQQ